MAGVEQVTHHVDINPRYARRTHVWVLHNNSPALGPIVAREGDRWLSFQQAAIGRAAEYGVQTELLIRTVDGATTAATNRAPWLRRLVPGRHGQDDDAA